MLGAELEFETTWILLSSLTMLLLNSCKTRILKSGTGLYARALSSRASLVLDRLGLASTSELPGVYDGQWKGSVRLRDLSRHVFLVERNCRGLSFDLNVRLLERPLLLLGLPPLKKLSIFWTVQRRHSRFGEMCQLLDVAKSFDKFERPLPRILTH